MALPWNPVYGVPSTIFPPGGDLVSDNILVDKVSPLMGRLLSKAPTLFSPEKRKKEEFAPFN
jgi:hypothetical protein